MLATAITYPCTSRRTSTSPRARRVRRREPASPLFLCRTTQHVRTRPWRVETIRAVVALANVVAWAAALYVVGQMP
jgi:hypothetical protein